MLKLLSKLIYPLLLGLFVFGTGYARGADDIENLLENGGFENANTAPWGVYGAATMEVVRKLEKADVDEDPIEGDFALHVRVNEKGANFWDIGLQHSGHVFKAGTVYTLSVYLKAKEGTMRINFKPELAADPWTAYGEREFLITDKWQEYHITTPTIPADVNPGSITFHIGYDVGEFWVDDAKFYEGKPPEDPNASKDLENGGFELGLPVGWSLYGAGSIEVVTKLNGAFFPDKPVEGRYALHVTVNEAGANFWDTGLQHAGHVFEAGKVYTLAAFLKSKEGPLEINFKPELAADPWTGYGEKQFTMSEEWEEFFVTTPPMPGDIEPASLTFHIGFTKGEFWMDGVRFYEGEYEEPDFSEPKAVSPRGKLGTTWGGIKAD